MQESSIFTIGDIASVSSIPNEKLSIKDKR